MWFGIKLPICSGTWYTRARPWTVALPTPQWAWTAPARFAGRCSATAHRLLAMIAFGLTRRTAVRLAQGARVT